MNSILLLIQMNESNVDLKKAIKNLSQLYDENSKDFFISLYLHRTDDDNYLKKRIHTCESLLDKDEKENFTITVEHIRSFLNENQEKNIAVFASDTYDFFTWVKLPITINNSFIVDSSPYIRPLARILDEWETFTLILMNSHQAKIFLIELGQADEKKNISKDIMNKHKKGGWSQPRFQRIRKGAIHDFFSEVMDQIHNMDESQIVLAGPGTAKNRFKEMLPQNIVNRIVDVIDVDMDDENESIKKSLTIISDQEETKSHKNVKQLKEEILKNGLAVYGFDETLKAAQNGQIDVLIVEKDYQLKGCLCEHCQMLKAGPIKKCPVCGGPTTEADIIEEIIEFANRTNATIEFTKDEEITKLGHIGGILRYKVE